MMAAAPSQRVLLHAFSSFSLGGAQSRFVQLANAFGARYRHVIVAMDGDWQAGHRLKDDVTWAPLSQTVVRGGGLGNRAAFRRTLQAMQPDLVLSYNWGATEWLAANWPPVARHIHVEDGFGPDEVLHQKPRRVWMRRILFRPPHVRLVVPSRRLLDLASSWWMPRARTDFIPNGVAIPSHALTIAPPHAPLTIGTVAGLRPEKNVGRLVRAFAALRSQCPARLLIVGDGSERRSLEDLAESLGVRGDIEFAGYLTNPLQRLADMDLFALSSDTEQLPISMLEAMAAGLPVLATSVGDVPHMLPSHLHGLALTAPDDAAFSLALQAMVRRRAEWPDLASLGRQQVSRLYNEAGMLAHWATLFDGRPGQPS